MFLLFTNHDYLPLSPSITPSLFLSGFKIRKILVTVDYWYSVYISKNVQILAFFTLDRAYYGISTIFHLLGGKGP